MRLYCFLLLILLAGSSAAAQTKQAKQAKRDFNAPFPAHKIVGNLYYVGTEQLATFLITTPQGHILINSDFEATVPVIRASVEKLGFKFTDIKILLGSHAHGDHMEGDALVKKLTGATVMAMEQDVPALRNMRPGGRDHPIDRVLHDGDAVTLGSTTLTAYLTPGHTKGCASWGLDVREDGKTYHALIVCSFGVNDGYVLVGNKDYPQIASDYVATFAKARSLPVDVFLGSHGFFYGLNEKYAVLKNRKPGEPNPFVDHAGYLAHIAAQEKRFETMLHEQQQAAH
jgi:metallo-beta-lactamase class B